MHYEKPVSLGDWMLTMLILAIPIVNLIMLIYWAFSSSTNSSKRTYCQAILMWGVIACAIVAIAAIFGQLPKT